MKLLTSLICVIVMLHCSYAPPVTPDKSEDSEIKDDLEEYMEYHRYLKEVVQALESDPDFRERLEKADEEDVKSGKIAEQLDFVNHNVRTRLDEIKRRELERLRHLATKQFELTNNLDIDMGKVPSSEHLDHANAHTFEIEDLKKLIMKTTSDLEAADKKRKEEFKAYEIQKEFEKHQKMEEMGDNKEYLEKVKQEEEAKKHHKPLHHPGSKPQLEEVWEKQDHMDQQFDPKVFFMMHDVDGNGVWDANEVKALFVKELDKYYGSGGPNKDLHERAEEMERMREHVFKENDKNHDGLIDFHEFMMATQRSDFNQDEGWKPIEEEENQVYTQAEYQEYERRRLEEIRFLQQRGLVDPHGRPLPGTEHQIHKALQEFHAYQQQHGYQQQQFQQPPYQGQAQQYPPQGQPPQGYQPPQGQYQAGQPQGQPPQGYQPPQGQYQAGQPQGQPQQGYQPPQGQYQAGQPQGQPPQGQYQGQQPVQAQQPSQGQQPPAQQPSQTQYQGQQPPQTQYQGQQPPQAQYQGQQPPQAQYQGQQPPQAQYQGQQPPQAQQPPQNQGQAPQANVNQGQVQQPPPVQGLPQAPPQKPQAQAVPVPPQNVVPQVVSPTH